MRQIGLLSLVFSAFTLVLFACSSESQDSNAKTTGKIAILNATTNSFDRTEFEEKKALWMSKNIGNYEMTMAARNSTNIAKQVVVKVENGKARSIVNSDPSDRGKPEQYKPLDTVEKIFNIIERESRIRHDIFTVKYDATLGYPSQVISDESLQGADEEFSIEVLSLKIK